MARNVINILGVSEPEPGGQPRSEVGGQRGRNMQKGLINMKPDKLEQKKNDPIFV